MSNESFPPRNHNQPPDIELFSFSEAARRMIESSVRNYLTISGDAQYNPQYEDEMKRFRSTLEIFVSNRTDSGLRPLVGKDQQLLQRLTNSGDSISVKINSGELVRREDFAEYLSATDDFAEALNDLPNADLNISEITPTENPRIGVYYMFMSKNKQFLKEPYITELARALGFSGFSEEERWDIEDFALHNGLPVLEELKG